MGVKFPLHQPMITHYKVFSNLVMLPSLNCKYRHRNFFAKIFSVSAGLVVKGIETLLVLG